jgi:Mn2+/Fe2+ NRAMP family transporter
MLWAAFPFLPLQVWSILVLVVSIAIIYLGKYGAVELVVKIAIVVFAVSTFVAFAVQAVALQNTSPSSCPAMAPAGAMMLFGSMFGYFPTTTEVSPMQSNWAVDKGNGMVKVKQLRRRAMRSSSRRTT